MQTAELEERKILKIRRLWKAAGPRGTEDVVSLSHSSCAEWPPDPVSHPDRCYHPLCPSTLSYSPASNSTSELVCGFSE